MLKSLKSKQLSTMLFVFSMLLSCKSQTYNGLQLITGNLGLGGSLIQNTNIDIATYNLSLQNDSTQFVLGKASLYSTQLPFYGITYNKGFMGRLDLRSVGSTDQFTMSYLDSARQSSNGLNIRKEQFSLSVYDNINIPARYEYGFTGYNTNADHFCFDRVQNIDLTLLKAHKDYARIQHYFNVAAGHYSEVIVNDKIYLQTDIDTALIADGNDVIMPGKGSSGAYFDNSTLVSYSSLKGSVSQTGNLTAGVTINRPIGYVRTVSSFLAAGASSIFTITNSYVKTNSIIHITVESSSTGTPYVFITGKGNGWFNVKVNNIHPVQSFNNTLNINFIIN